MHAAAHAPASFKRPMPLPPRRSTVAAMSVLAVAGRFQIEICDVRTPEAAEQNTQVAGCIQEIVDQEFRLVEDITRLRWSLLAYERSDPPFRQQLCDIWADEARQRCRQSLVIGDERSTWVFLHKPDQRQIKLEIADVKPAC